MCQCLTTCITRPCAALQDVRAFAYQENYGFSRSKVHLGKRMVFYWKDAFIRTSCFCDSPYIMITWCCFCIFLLNGVSIWEYQDRESVPDHDNDGLPGAKHLGRRVAYGLELQHLVWFFMVAYFTVKLYISFLLRNYAHMFTNDYEETTPAAKILWFTHIVSHPLAVTSALVYFTFLRNNENHTTASNVAYATYAVVAILDAIISRVPYLIVHVVWSTLVGAFYVFFITTSFYWSLPADETHRYIYSAIDWSHPLDTFIRVVGFGFIHFAVYVFLCSWSLFREFIMGTSWTLGNVYEEDTTPHTTETTRLSAIEFI